MTLQEAIQSGKPFRRKGMGTQNYIEVLPHWGGLVYLNGYRKGLPYFFEADDIFAIDWETKDWETKDDLP